MTSETSPAAESGEASVVIARFDSYRHAEHMLASLGRGFRTKARKGGTTAVVVRGNPDGSLKVTESRVLSASDFMSTLIHLSLSWTIGFIGLFSMLKGAKSEARAARVRKGHTGSDEQRAHELLAEAGPHGGPGAGPVQGRSDAAAGCHGRGRQRGRQLGWLADRVSRRP
jgi:hypothetical protein